MQISITFKNIDSSDALKSQIHEKFDRLDKMFDSHTVWRGVLPHFIFIGDTLSETCNGK